MKITMDDMCKKIRNVSGHQTVGRTSCILGWIYVRAPSLDLTAYGGSVAPSSACSSSGRFHPKLPTSRFLGQRRVSRRTNYACLVPTDESISTFVRHSAFEPVKQQFSAATQVKQQKVPCSVLEVLAGITPEHHASEASGT